MSFTVWNLSENQADCFLIVLENKNQEKITILVDGNKESSNYENVKKVIDKKCERLDYIVVSHVDDDHLGGIIKMLEGNEWKCAENAKIFYNYVVKRNVSYKQAKRFEELIEGRTILSSYKDDYPLDDGFLNVLSVDTRKLCMEIEKNKNVKAYLTLIKPAHADIKKVQADCKRVLDGKKNQNSGLINRNSLVILLEFEGKSAIFTGDANWNQIETSLNKFLGADYEMDLIKIPHHGAINNNKQLVEYASKHKTRYFIVTGNEQWDKKHPNESLIKDIEDKCPNAEIYTLIQNISSKKIKSESWCNVEK